MAVDKAVDSVELDAKLKAIADSIREKTGDSTTMALDDMPDKMDAVFQAGIDSLPRAEDHAF